VFVGGWVGRQGGKNWMGGVRVGAPIIHGPHVWNFAEIYAALDAARGAQPVGDEEALAERLGAWLADPAARQAAAEAATATIKKLGGALDRTWAALDPYLIQLRLEGRA